MTIINPSLRSNAKWTHFTQTKMETIAVNLLREVLSLKKLKDQSPIHLSKCANSA